MKWLQFVMVSVLASLTSFAEVTRETEWQDVPDGTKVGEVLDLSTASGGTTNYNALINKPRVNGVELSGNKSLSDLDIQVEISDLQNIREGAAKGSTSIQRSDITDMETKTHAGATYQPKGNYLTSLTPAINYATAISNKLESTKQGVIADLSTIREGAAKGATALQEHQSLAPATNYANVVARSATNYTDAVFVSYTNGIRKVDGAARPLPKYLHALEFADSYAAEAAWYYAQPQDYGSCSAVYDGRFLYRNFDYPFDDRAEFVVKMSAGVGRFASIGVANCGTNLTEAVVTSGKWSRYYKCLAGRTVDGINENGVVAEVNVVDGTPSWHTGGDIHPLAAVRWALDNGTSAGMVASNLAARIAFPQGWTQNFHYMISDEREAWIVENGSAIPASEYHEPDEPATMTNFPLNQFPWAGTGMERFGLLLGGANITNAWFTRAYSRSTNWASEFKNAQEMEAAKSAWETYTKEQLRGHGLWQTLHTSIYDITNRTLRIAVQEQDDWYVFAVAQNKGGTDEVKVREIAEDVVAPVAEEVAKKQDKIHDYTTTNAANDIASGIVQNATTYMVVSNENREVLIGDGGLRFGRHGIKAIYDDDYLNGILFERKLINSYSYSWRGFGASIWVDGGAYSLALGNSANASGIGATALGNGATANGEYSVAFGAHETIARGDFSAVFGTDASAGDFSTAIGYGADASPSNSIAISATSHGTNTINFGVTDNPRSIYFKDKTFADIVADESQPPEDYTTTNAVRDIAGAMISETNATFSAAVLAVGVNISEDARQLLEAIGGLDPTTGAVSLGSLLAAILAALIWLRTNKADKSELPYETNTTATLKDRAVNQLGALTTSYTLTIPDAATSGKPRDFLLRYSSSGAVEFQYSGITLYGDLPSTDKGGDFLVAITEVGTNQYYCRKITLENAQ